MNRCTGSTMMGPCSCGLYHYQQSSFSSIFPMPYEQEICAYGSSPSSVDCTLSLGTPSTRMSNDYEKTHSEKRRGSNWWNILQSSSHSPTPSSQKASRGGSNGNGSANGSDSLFSRRCANCDTTSTPLWRNGPRGPKSLCNACGIRYKKEERRANAAAAAAVSTGGSDASEGYHHQYMMNNNGNQWVNDHYAQSTYKMPSCYSPAAASNEFRFMDHDMDDRDSPFLSWRLNVTDRPGLVHDY
ncbi:zinc finger, NHR/GATA-type [Artemisia annua]|uniref:Zinc finger, NHR/GATA-type n=1 Tax=Artemisia annua TaxID=35608 RepID=A0A2U1QMR1_ARTAN|nr:zinc finger, NHR/GATA-type [Artemisia annua]PWA99278.1 zinc finger, NHR/GATA-type [Artemisia annua]